MKNYLKRTWKNKVVAVMLVVCGYVPMILDYDATAFVFMLMLATPLFFAKENYIF